MRNLFLSCITVISLISLSSAVYGATSLVASVDKNPVMVGEQFTLTLTANAKLNQSNLDSSALLKQFTVGSTSMGSSTRIVNGDISQQTTWNISLVQLNAGQYKIPSFTVNGASSEPIDIEVIKQPTTGKTTTDNQDVKLVVEFEHTSAYVGQQLLYRVKLYIGTALQRAQLQAPTLEGAEISPLGEDEDSTEILNGRRYRVISRNYSIRPTQAGEFQLSGSVFRGDISLSQRTSFFNNGRSKPVTLIGDSKPFSVLPIPESFPGDWLVSAQVALDDQWTEQSEYKVGEPITRTITLTAADTTVEQLPSIAPKFGPGINTYPDKRTTQQGLNGTTLIAQAVQKFAVIPSAAGKVTFPEVRLPWFNSRSNELQWATLPAKTIIVVQGEAPVTQEMTPTLPDNVIKPAATTTAPIVVSHANGQLIYWQLATLTLSLLLIMAIVFIVRHNRRVSPTLKKQPRPTTGEGARMEKALSDKDASAILKEFPLWLASEQQLDLAQLASVAPELARQYQTLATNRFGQHTAAIDVAAFAAQFKGYCRQLQQNDTAPLSGLYPNQRR